MPDRRLHVEIFLIALAIMLLDVSYTRVFSFKLVYYFTYVIIGIAMLGLGAGGVMVAMFGGLRRAAAARVLPVCCLAGSASVFLGYLVVAKMPLDTAALVGAVGATGPVVDFIELGKLLFLCVCLFVPFFSGGLAIATIFATHAARINRLYFADLLGAALGSAAAVPLMIAISPPGCVMLAGAVLAVAGWPLSRTISPGRSLAIAVVASSLLLTAVFPEWLPDPIPDQVKTMGKPGRPAVRFTQWSPVFRIDVLDDFFGREDLVISHDGMFGSMLPRFDGDPASLTDYDEDVRQYPFKVLSPSPRVAIIGSAGGNEILASLRFSAEHVTAVELNPVTVSLLREHYADFTGHMAEHERVSLHNAEGRSFLMGSQDSWDLIWFVAPDSYAAMNAASSGAFVLSESYLYTEEMIAESLRHLSPDGIICAQFGEIDFDRKPNRTTRYLTTARSAFRRLGVDDFDQHVLVASAKDFIFHTSTVLMKRSPFDQDEIDRFVSLSKSIEGGTVRYAVGAENRESPVTKAITLQPVALHQWYERYPFDVRPVTDDIPFFWHFVSFADALQPKGHLGTTHWEEAVGERLLIVLLVVVVTLAAVFLLAPLLARRDTWRAVPYKGSAAFYFAALGLGFMFLEVSLIQRLTLFLGYPTYSLSVTLFALLTFTGVGSLASEGALANRNRVVSLLLVGLTLLVGFYLLALPGIVHACIAWTLAARIALTVAFLAPLGLCLGVFMPLGLRTVSGLSVPHAEEYVAWGWAVNGFFSVVASVLSTMLAMTIGFDLVMIVALAIYGIGIAALLRIPAPSEPDTAGAPQGP